SGCGNWKKLSRADMELRVEELNQRDSLGMTNTRSDRSAIYEWLQSSTFSTAVILADSTLTIHPDKGLQLDRGSVLYLYGSQYQGDRIQERSLDQEEHLTHLQENTYHQSEEIDYSIDQRSRHPPNPMIWIGF